MNEKNVFRFRNLEHKSNAILGFIVLQSLYLCDRLGGESLKRVLDHSNEFAIGLLSLHLAIVVLGVISTCRIGNRSKRILADMEVDLFAKQSTFIKACLIIVFGLMPIVIIFTFNIIGVNWQLDPYPPF